MQKAAQDMQKHTTQTPACWVGSFTYLDDGLSSWSPLMKLELDKFVLRGDEDRDARVMEGGSWAHWEVLHQVWGASLGVTWPGD